MGLNSSLFYKELTELLNTHSIDNECNTPDFILTQYIIDCMLDYGKVIRTRDKWLADEN